MYESALRAIAAANFPLAASLASSCACSLALALASLVDDANVRPLPASRLVDAPARDPSLARRPRASAHRAHAHAPPRAPSTHIARYRRTASPRVDAVASPRVAARVEPRVVVVVVASSSDAHRASARASPFVARRANDAHARRMSRRFAALRARAPVGSSARARRTTASRRVVTSTVPTEAPCDEGCRDFFPGVATPGCLGCRVSRPPRKIGLID